MVKTAAEKLGHRGGALVVLGAVPGDVAAVLQAGAGTSPGAVVVLFAEGFHDLAGVPAAVAATDPGGRTWVAYRKGASRRATADGVVPLHRDTLQQALAEQGYEGVTLVALDPTWSALRVKPLPTS